MSGLAKTSQFLLATATVMIGKPEDVFELTPAAHSVGLVKNVQMTNEPTFTELMQGLTSEIVYSVNTNNNVTLSFEVYEYTARNMAYAAGIEASGPGFDPSTLEFALASEVAPNATSITVAPVGMPAGAFAAGDWVLLQAGTSDLMFAARVATVAAAGLELTLASGFVLPANVTWTVAGTRVFKVRPIKVGTQPNDSLVGIKIAGILPERSEPVTIIFPKCRIQRGLTMSFQNENFSNMPFEVRPYSLLPTDPFYADFDNGTKRSMLLRR